MAQGNRPRACGPGGDASGLCAYAADLLDRLKGVAAGPASLALWRSFAWRPRGSPKKDFTLSTDGILAAQDSLAAGIDRITRVA
jgi:hypothetical protein